MAKVEGERTGSKCNANEGSVPSGGRDLSKRDGNEEGRTNPAEEQRILEIQPTPTDSRSMAFNS